MNLSQRCQLLVMIVFLTPLIWVDVADLNLDPHHMVLYSDGLRLEINCLGQFGLPSLFTTVSYYRRSLIEEAKNFVLIFKHYLWFSQVY